MSKKVVVGTGTASLLVVLFIAGIVLFPLDRASLPNQASLSPPSRIVASNSPHDKNSSRILAESWIQEHAPTFVFDGSDLQHKTTATLECAACYQIAFTFLSQYIGYGNREGKNLPEIKTPHTVKIQIKNGEVTSAVTDGVFDEKQQRMIPEAKEDMPKNSVRLVVEDLERGTGQLAEPGDTLVVHYTGTLEDGTVFDDSRTREHPFRFMLGTRQVIQGWDLGIQGMREGGSRRIIIPPELAYGDRGVGPIPPNATLIFEVELLSVEKQ